MATTYGCFVCGRDMEELEGPQICLVCKARVRVQHKTVLRQHRTTTHIKFYGRCQGCGEVSRNMSTSGMVAAWSASHLDHIIKVMEKMLT